MRCVLKFYQGQCIIQNRLLLLEFLNFVLELVVLSDSILNSFISFHFVKLVTYFNNLQLSLVLKSFHVFLELIRPPDLNFLVELFKNFVGDLRIDVLVYLIFRIEPFLEFLVHKLQISIIR